MPVFCSFTVRWITALSLLFLSVTYSVTQTRNASPININPLLRQSLTAYKEWKLPEAIRAAKAAYSQKNATIQERYFGHLLSGTALYRARKAESALREFQEAKKLRAKSRIPADNWLVKLAKEWETLARRDSAPVAVAVKMASSQTLAAAQINRADLNAIVQEAKASHTDALTIWKDGKPLVTAHTGKVSEPIELMSLTRSIASLAIMFLLDEGKIPSIDQPIGAYYRSWQKFPAGAPLTITRRAKVTLRHLMDDTSGIALQQGDKTFDFNKNIVAYALTRDVETEPGTVAAYNNVAVNLLSGIVRQVSGESIETYLRKKLFAPLGITQYHWIKDQADNPVIYVGLSLQAEDAAKIGQLLLDGGVWKGKRLIRADRIREFTRTASNPKTPTTGLLWWLIPHEIKYRLNDAVWAAWNKAKAPPALMKKLAVYRGRAYTTEDWNSRLKPVFIASGYPWRQNSEWAWKQADVIASQELDAFNGNGYYGQPLLVISATRIIAVRQIRAGHHQSRRDGFPSFISRILALTKKSPTVLKK